LAEGEKRFDNIGSIKPGSYVIIDGFACQVKSVDKSKPGKHGSTKARIVAMDIFSGQKRGLLKPTSADAEIPIIAKGNAQVVAVMGDTVQIMDLVSYETFDVKKPQDVSGLESGVEVEYLRWGDQVKVVRKKGS